VGFRPAPEIASESNIEANLPNRVSEIHFRPFRDLQRDESSEVAVEELFRTSTKTVPGTVPTTPRIPPPSTLSDGYVSVIKKGDLPRRRAKVVSLNVTEEEDDDSNMMEKMLTEYKKSTHTRSRRGRSRLTKTTQERNRCRVTLTKDKYYCTPDLAELDAFTDDDGHCFVKNFEVGHLEWGKVIFDGIIDVATLNLDTSSKYLLTNKN
jgi:hypothetical protein